MNNIVVVLTGTINPNKMTYTKVNDITHRTKQYLDSIKFWLSIKGIKVIFVENSGINLLEICPNLNDKNSNNFECLYFDGNSYDRNLGKGFGELLCLKYACLHSKLLQEADFVFKVTGRLKVKNINKFINFISKTRECEILADMKHKLTYTDSRFFGMSRFFLFNYIINYMYTDDSKGIYFEHALSRVVLRGISEGMVFCPMPCLPYIQGQSGSSGEKYSNNALYRFYYQFRYYIKYKSFLMGSFPKI